MAIDTNNTEEQIQNTPKKRGRKPKVKKGYFEDEQEKAFREFLVCTDKAERDKIFANKIYPALCKMIECIIRRYTLFSVDEDYEDTFYDTLSFLITKIQNFQPEKNKKAYSYCGTICRNYLTLKRIQSIKKRERYLSYDTMFPNSERDNRVEGITNNEAFNAVLITNTRNEIEAILKDEKKQLSLNERKVGGALLEILSNWEEMWEEMLNENCSNKFNKMSMLYFIKEYTNCNTTEVRNAMKVYKDLYIFTKKELIKSDNNL